MRSLAVVLAAVGLCTMFGFGGAAAQPAASTPDGSSPPPGADDWHCAPTSAHPDPVVLVHGTWGNQNNWDALSPKLKSQGYCVFSLNYGRDVSSTMGAEPGVYGTGDIRDSARELATFIQRVCAATNSEHVDVVAHSQGGVVARQYMRFGGGVDRADPRRNVVRKLVTIGATNHGTTFKDLGFLASTGSSSGPIAGAVAQVLGVAAAQQVIGSRFLAHLNADGDTDPGVDYTVIASRVDDVTTPPESTFLSPGPQAVVDNIWVQAVCATDTVDHSDLPQSPTVIRIVERALNPGFSAVNRCAHP
ncbi:alpha/beta fold hydrolase [Nocardia sp. NEAU-G5]|uniref:Alpha/beta fold hydrolase n=1 Tax=Nocardia albiluteola TaxID=2842303 RepID=A0ABS6ART3_9NOCA|nr:alpha/beta fold hydrolase [Nocardia albiluteola]MBU3060740.1 alpha/beta fold hydrolase [Nocardia albiluteola]